MRSSTVRSAFVEEQSRASACFVAFEWDPSRKREAGDELCQHDAVLADGVLRNSG
jgi:hypothetical protein